MDIKTYVQIRGNNPFLFLVQTINSTNIFDSHTYKLMPINVFPLIKFWNVMQ